MTSSSRVLRTLGQAVAETGLVLSVLTLFPDQVRLLNDDTLRLVHLYGPPGTGKTLVMVLKGCQWLKQGLDVQVLVARKDGRAVSFLIEEQLRQVLDSSDPVAAGGARVRRHVYDFHKNSDDVQKAVDEMTAHARDGELYVIADEVLDFFCVTR